MKLARWTFLPLLLVPLVGCKSAEKPDYYGEIVSDLGALQTEMKDAIFQVDTVANALDQLAAARGDLRQPLAAFSKSVDDLEKTTAQIRNLGKEVKAKESAYQSSSAKEMEEIESSDLRRTAEHGRSVVAASFKSMGEKGESLNTMYDDWESTLKFIQSSLESDLSADNLRSLAGKIEEVNDATPKIKEGMRMLANDFQSTSASMNPAP